MVGLQTMEVIVHSSRWMDLSQQNDRLIRVFIWPWILPGGRPQPVNISLKNNPSKKIHWKWPIYNGWYWFDGKYTSHSIAFDSFPFVSVFVSFQNCFSLIRYFRLKLRLLKEFLVFSFYTSFSFTIVSIMFLSPFF